MKRIDIIDNNKEYIKYLKSKIKNQDQIQMIINLYHFLYFYLA